MARPLADRHVLLRRVYLDLIGLPPSREQLRALLADESPDAYERMVDSLLVSPHHGERWGRHWLDVWRYSDWYGFQNEVRCHGTLGRDPAAGGTNSKFVNNMQFG